MGIPDADQEQLSFRFFLLLKSFSTPGLVYLLAKDPLHVFQNSKSNGAQIIVQVTLWALFINLLVKSCVNVFAKSKAEQKKNFPSDLYDFREDWFSP